MCVELGRKPKTSVTHKLVQCKMQEEERAVTYDEIIMDKHKLTSRSEVATDSEIANCSKTQYTSQYFTLELFSNGYYQQLLYYEFVSDCGFKLLKTKVLVMKSVDMQSSLSHNLVTFTI
jgi:hypothetical protein